MEFEKLKNNSDDNLKPKKKNGGARPGAGRKKGGKNAATLEKERVLAEVRQRIVESADSLLDSQMNLAKGCQFLFVVETKKYEDENGKIKIVKNKPKIVKDPEIIASYLAGELDHEENEYYFMTTQKPDNKALDSLFDRTFGKSQTNLDITTKGDSVNELNEEQKEKLDRILNS